MTQIGNFPGLTAVANRLAINADEKQLKDKGGKGAIDGKLDYNEIKQLSGGKISEKDFQKYAGKDKFVDADEYAKLRGENKDIKFEVKA